MATTFDATIVDVRDGYLWFSDGSRFPVPACVERAEIDGEEVRLHYRPLLPERYLFRAGSEKKTYRVMNRRRTVLTVLRDWFSVPTAGPHLLTVHGNRCLFNDDTEIVIPDRLAVDVYAENGFYDYVLRAAHLPDGSRIKHVWQPLRAQKHDVIRGIAEVEAYAMLGETPEQVRDFFERLNESCKAASTPSS